MIFTRGLRVCLAVEPVDLRRGFEGLALLVKGALEEDERSSQIFVFTNKRRDRIRLLYWDGTGLWLMTKRLEQGTFAWPQVPPGAAKISLRPEALEPERSGDRQPSGCPEGEGAARRLNQMLLSGIDLKGAQMGRWYEEPEVARRATGG